MGRLFGGVAGAVAAIVVQWQFAALSSGRAALLVGLLTVVIFLLLVVVANLTGVMPKDTQGGDTTGSN